MIGGVNGFAHSGNLRVIVTQGVRPPNHWAAICAAKIIGISETADPAIREQAIAFRNRIEAEIANYIAMAVNETRTSIAAELDELGVRELAEKIRKGG